MKLLMLVLVLFGAGFTAMSMTAQNKPAATVAAEAISPLAAQFSGMVSGSANDYLAGMPGPVGDGARRTQQKTVAATARSNRATRRPMADCLKPGALIDLDVKECMDGTRVKEW
jgi:type IV secretory pathway TrbL component